MPKGDGGPRSEHETVWDAEVARGAERPSSAPGDTDLRPGPIALPARLRGKSATLGWIVSLVLVLLAVAVYVFTRPPAPGSGHAAPPTWGHLTLSAVALNAAKGAGEANPTGATWMFVHRGDALGVLSGQNTGEAEADFLVSMTGHFQGVSGSDVLPGSQPGGDHLIVLVRAFDGEVTGRLVTDTAYPDLAKLGVINPLRLGGL